MTAPPDTALLAVDALIADLELAMATMANDDTSAPGTRERARMTDRLGAMKAAAAALSALRQRAEAAEEENKRLRELRAEGRRAADIREAP